MFGFLRFRHFVLESGFWVWGPGKLALGKRTADLLYLGLLDSELWVMAFGLWTADLKF